jgi:hypothetical protein
MSRISGWKNPELIKLISERRNWIKPPFQRKEKIAQASLDEKS